MFVDKEHTQVHDAHDPRGAKIPLLSSRAGPFPCKDLFEGVVQPHEAFADLVDEALEVELRFPFRVSLLFGLPYLVGSVDFKAVMMRYCCAVRSMGMILAAMVGCN